MILEDGMHDLTQKSGEGVCFPCGNAHSTRLAPCPHFTAFAELCSLLFLVVSLQDSLTSEEPLKVLKVGLYISACLVACEEVDIKPTLGCSGKAILLLWNKVRYLEGYKVNIVYS